MLSNLNDRLKQAMKSWTLSKVRPDLTQAVTEARPATNEYGLDPFGFSLDYSLSALAPFVWLYQHYFRVVARGLEHVPRGRVLIIANHSGQLPFDAAMIGVALLTEPAADPPRAVRSMVEKWVPTLPFVSVFLSRLGQVVGTPENARRLLEADEALLVFPEGVKGLNKLFRRRYQLQDFGLGFMRLALETQTPVVPVAVIGAEEQAPALFDAKPLARLLRMPAMPITPTVLPFPLPSRYHLHFGEPLSFSGSPHDEDAELEKKVKTVKAALQAMLNRGLKERASVYF
jgi:1-acyl-sn-glycerol-3-phosphate acyltransferase